MRCEPFERADLTITQMPDRAGAGVHRVASSTRRSASRTRSAARSMPRSAAPTPSSSIAWAIRACRRAARSSPFRWSVRAQAAMHVASLLGHRFSFITVLRAPARDDRQAGRGLRAQRHVRLVPRGRHPGARASAWISAPCRRRWPARRSRPCKRGRRRRHRARLHRISRLRRRHARRRCSRQGCDVPVIDPIPLAVQHGRCAGEDRPVAQQAQPTRCRASKKIQGLPVSGIQCRRLKPHASPQRYLHVLDRITVARCDRRRPAAGRSRTPRRATTSSKKSSSPRRSARRTSATSASP